MMTDVLEIPCENSLLPDERFTFLQTETLRAIWRLTDGLAGAWCDAAAIRKRAGDRSVSSLRHLVERGVVEGRYLGDRRPHSRHSWPTGAVYRLTRDGYAEVASALNFEGRAA